MTAPTLRASDLPKDACGYERRGDGSRCMDTATLKIIYFRRSDGRRRKRLSCPKHIGRKVEALANDGDYYKIVIFHVGDPTPEWDYSAPVRGELTAQ